MSRQPSQEPSHPIGKKKSGHLSCKQEPSRNRPTEQDTPDHPILSARPPGVGSLTALPNTTRGTDRSGAGRGTGTVVWDRVKILRKMAEGTVCTRACAPREPPTGGDGLDQDAAHAAQLRDPTALESSDAHPAVAGAAPASGRLNGPEGDRDPGAVVEIGSRLAKSSRAAEMAQLFRAAHELGQAELRRRFERAARWNMLEMQDLARASADNRCYVNHRLRVAIAPLTRPRSSE